MRASKWTFRTFVGVLLVTGATTAEPAAVANSVTLIADPSTVTTGGETEVGDASVALLPGGGHVAVWRQRDPVTHEQQVFFRVFDEAGNGGEPTPLGAPVVWNPDATVAANAAGSFLIAWTAQGVLWGQLFDRTGRPLAEAGEVDPEAIVSASEPRVLSHEGQFLVIWNRQASQSHEAWARFYGADGRPLGDPSLVWSGGGAWGGALRDEAWLALIGRDPSNGDLPTLWATRSQGGLFGGEVVPVVATRDGFSGENCGVVALADGGALLLWGQTDETTGADVVRARRLAADGSLVGTEATISAENASYVHAAEVTGGALAVWQEESRAVIIQALTADGLAIGPSQVVAPAVAGEYSWRPRVSALNEEGVVVWETEQPATNATAVYTRRVTTRCSAGNRLCLGSAGRFEVAVDWRTQQGDVGHGTALQLTSDSGAVWFFGATNLELMVKLIDACSFNNRYWVFVAGLTDVQVTLTVTDTASEAVRTYVNPLKQAFQPIQDTSAFATCPLTAYQPMP
jgi:hypothetical protein